MKAWRNHVILKEIGEKKIGSLFLPETAKAFKYEVVSVSDIIKEEGLNVSDVVHIETPMIEVEVEGVKHFVAHVEQIKLIY